MPTHRHRPPTRTDPPLPSPFTRAEALAAGLSDHDLRSRRYQPIFWGVYADASVTITPLLRATAALMVCSAGVRISHNTAAGLWQLWVPDDPETHVSVPAGSARSKRRGIRAHLATAADQVVQLGGLPISSPVQCFLELAARLDLVDLVILGDSIVRRGHASPADLVAAAERWEGRGCRLARRAAALVRAGVDSPMETRLRLLIVLAGLPEPVVNHTLYAADGRWRVRFDLSYPDWRIAIEYDGRQHAESDAQWQHDLNRREHLDGLDWRLLVVRSHGIYVDPGQTIQRVVEVLRQRGVAAGIRVRGDEWRQHFPGRTAA